MNDMTYAKEIMNSLLMEAELKDSFGEFAEESIIRLVLLNNSEETFQVTKNHAGRIEMVNLKTHIKYTFTKDAIDDGVMTLHKVDSKKPNTEGAKITLKLKEFMTSKKNGELVNVDIVDEDMVERQTEINNELRSAKKNDILYITTDEKNSKGNIMNNILLKVVDKEVKMLTCILEDIESTDGEGSSTKSYAMNKLGDIFGRHSIYIHSSDLVKIIKGSLTLTVQVGGKPLDIKNIIQIEAHDEPERNLDPQDKEVMAKQEFLKKYGHSEEFLQAIEKTPSFWETLVGASPKGRSQIEKIINKSMTNNSYFTRGSKITFILASPTVHGSNNRSLVSTTKTYVGTMYPNKILQVNDKRTGHFELELVRQPNPLEPIYNVKIRYCDKRLRCKYKGVGVINVIRNNG